jgi:hypothetical protein
VFCPGGDGTGGTGLGAGELEVATGGVGGVTGVEVAGGTGLGAGVLLSPATLENPDGRFKVAPWAEETILASQHVEYWSDRLLNSQVQTNV